MSPGFTRERTYLVCDDSGVIAICTYICNARDFVKTVRADNGPGYKVRILTQTVQTSRELLDY